jgi:hypothetical protein
VTRYCKSEFAGCGSIPSPLLNDFIFQVGERETKTVDQLSHLASKAPRESDQDKVLDQGCLFLTYPSVFFIFNSRLNKFQSIERAKHNMEVISPETAIQSILIPL